MYKQLLTLILSISLSSLCHAQVDTTVGLTAPKGETKDYKELSHYLCDGLSGDQEKANAIYNWITHNIKYDVKSVQKSSLKADKVEKVLKNKKGVCTGYATLFSDMCREAGIKSVTIDGYAKDWIFDNGDKLYIPRHMWSAVLINGKWQFADPTWGAGYLYQSQSTFHKLLRKVLGPKVVHSVKLKFKFKYDPKYFLQPREEFCLKHLPTDPYWQLADTAMPLAVFEAGDSAIISFNKKYAHTKANSAELMKICDLDEDHKTAEYADRAYAYNNRFPVVLSIKQEMHAVTAIQTSLDDSNASNIGVIIKDAKVSLKQSDDYIKDQRKTFAGEYSTLKKKNKIKNQQAKEYIRKIDTDDKRLISQSKKYTNATKSKFSSIKKKNADANKRRSALYPTRLDDIENAKQQKHADAPELLAIADSITARKKRIDELQKEVLANEEKIKKNETDNNDRLVKLGTTLQLADSMLVQETIARLNMHDNYDNEVIDKSKVFEDLKYKQADTLHKYYMVNYDTINSIRDRQLKIQKEQMDMYKANVRNVEQYKKWNSSTNDVTGQYADWVKSYLDCIDTYNSELAAYAAYIKNNKKLFTYLAKVNKRQLRITAVMRKAEENRKKLEEKTLIKKQTFDVAENQQQGKNIKELTKKVKRLEDQIN